MPADATLVEKLTGLVESRAKLNPKHDELHALCTAIGNDQRLAHLSPDELFGAAKSIVRDKAVTPEAGTELVHEMFIGGGKNDTFMAKLLKPAEDLVADERAAASSAYSAKAHSTYSGGGASRVQTKPVTMVDRITQQWSSAAHETKVASGMNFLISGLCAVSAFRQLNQAVAKDDNGERHIQPTQVGLGIVSALLAAGTAYLGAQALRTGHSH